MKQVVQSVGDGTLRVVEVPTPMCGPAEVLVATTRSLLSTGTEKAVRELASASLIAKAKARPDLVRQVVKKARAEGLRSTARAVRTRLDEDMPLGYSATGVVVEVGASVSGISPGMRVATASAGHAGMQVVPALLAVPVPPEVSDDAAAFGAVAAIALQGLRQADVQLGGTVAVVGLGLVGQLTVRLALAAGLNVIGVDLQEWKVELARTAGAVGFVEDGSRTTDAIVDSTRGRGVDSVLVTASTKSSDPVMSAVDRVRDSGRVVVVGDVSVEIRRTPFYMKEVDLRFARSYGPGRYDRTYEEYGVDYPVGQVRWTEGRNIEAYLDLVASGRVVVDDLVTHTWDIDDAQEAYRAIESDTSALAVQLRYPDDSSPRQSELLRPIRPAHGSSALIGAGLYAKVTLMPAIKQAGLATPVAVTSRGGLSARHLADRHGIAEVVRDTSELLRDPSISSLFVVTSHDTHASIATAALDAGKHVFVEKPIALTDEELDQVLAASQASGTVLWGGFNRRHSSSVAAALETISGSTEPLVMTYRVAAGRLPDTHWYKDRRHGGRVVGELCHYIDTCSWLVGRPVEAVVALGSRRAETALQEDIAVVLRFGDGSLATVSYAEHPHPSAPKERLEILGRGHSIVLDDFHRVEIDGKERRVAPGKGHVENLRLFADVVAGQHDGIADRRATIASSAATLAAVESLQTACLVQVDPRVGDAPFA